MQVTILGNDEHAVRLNLQALGNQINRHGGVAGQHFMQLCGHDGDVINDDDGHPHVSRKMFQQTDVRVEAASRSANANNGEAFDH